MYFLVSLTKFTSFLTVHKIFWSEELFTKTRKRKEKMPTRYICNGGIVCVRDGNRVQFGSMSASSVNLICGNINGVPLNGGCINLSGLSTQADFEAELIRSGVWTRGMQVIYE
jgi:hypothetical protein